MIKYLKCTTVLYCHREWTTQCVYLCLQLYVVEMKCSCWYCCLLCCFLCDVDRDVTVQMRFQKHSRLPHSKLLPIPTNQRYLVGSLIARFRQR